MHRYALYGASGPARRLLPGNPGEPLLDARLRIPALPRILVPRPALVERLTAGLQYPLTVVSGPAGAGKTVLAAQWASDGAVAAPAVWVTAEPGDTPQTFWPYVVEGLRRRGVRLPVGTQADGHAFLARLAEALAGTREPVVVVVDQFDAVASPEVADALHYLLQHSGGALRAVLTCRSDPLLPLHRYRAAGDIVEIRNAELRFTADAAAELLRDHGLDVPEEVVRTLTDRTDGWAAGLRLSALAMRSSAAPEEFAGTFAAAHTTIADYLTTEVLDAQPRLSQELLLRIAVTERINPALADRLTGRHDAEWTLARLARDSAFLEPADASGWYRLHPLFGEILRAHLRHRHPGLESRLHARAARWFAASGELTESVLQAVAGGDWPFAADELISNVAIGRLFTGLDAERLHVLSAMPTELDGPAPALVRAACLLAVADVAAARGQLRHADEQLTGEPSPETLLSRALLAVLAGRLAGDPAMARRAADDADRLMRVVPLVLLEARPEVPALVLAGVGAAELDAGRLETAERRLRAAVDASGQPGLEYPLSDALASLAMVELLRGRIRQAKTHAEAAPDVAERSAVAPRVHSGMGDLVLAGVAVERDDLATARARLDRWTAEARLVPPSAAVVAAVSESRLASAAGDWPRALSVLAEAAEGTLADGRRLPDWARDELTIAESAAHLAHGNPTDALTALDADDNHRPQHTVAKARALIAAGRHEDAMQVLAGLDDESAAVTARVEAYLLRAEADAQCGHEGTALRLLCTALALARPEEPRRLFAEVGPGVRRIFRQEPQLAKAHRWLPGNLAGHAATDARRWLTAAAVEPLTGRETEVLGLAAQLLATDEIADRLCLSVNTVKTHLKSCYRKLAVRRRSEAVSRARQLGLL